MNNRLSEGDWKIPHRGNTGERYRFVELNLKVWATAINSAGREMQEGKEGKWNSDAGNGPASHIQKRESNWKDWKRETIIPVTMRKAEKKNARWLK